MSVQSAKRCKFQHRSNAIAGGYDKLTAGFCPVFATPPSVVNGSIVPGPGYLGGPTIEATAEDCTALCDADANCKQFAYNR